MATELRIKIKASVNYDLYDIIMAQPEGWNWIAAESVHVVKLTDAGEAALISSLGLNNVIELRNEIFQPIFDDINSKDRVITKARRFKINIDPTNSGTFTEIDETNIIDKV